MASRQETPSRSPRVASRGVGLGTTDHEDPFQFSISAPAGLPLWFVIAPVAQQSRLLTQVTPLR
jgi:hypothetical protein